MPSSLAESNLGGRLLRHLQAGVRTRSLYPRDHPEVRSSAQAVAEDVAAAGPGEVTLAIIDGEAFLDGRPLRDATLQQSTFLREMAERGIEVLRFTSDLTADEACTLIELLRMDPAELEIAGGPAAYLEDRAALNIVAERLVRLPTGRYEVTEEHDLGDAYGAIETVASADPGARGGGEPAVGPYEPPRPAQRAYGRVIGDIRAVYAGIEQGGAVNASALGSMAEALVSDLLDDPSAFVGLLHLRGQGEDLFQHGINTAILSVLLGSKLELEEEQLRVLGIGALLHDIGELFVPRYLRMKAEPLTEAEWELVRQHPARGAKLLLATEGLDPVAATIALEHHIGFQAQGYPRLRGMRRSHLYARIAAVADAYDALTHPRPYQRNRGELHAIEQLLRGAGTHFDPTVVKLLLHAVGYYPPGTPVELTDGRRGVVRAPTPGQPFLPSVTVERDGGYEIVDTSALDERGEPRRAVARCLGAADVPAPLASDALRAATVA